MYVQDNGITRRFQPQHRRGEQIARYPLHDVLEECATVGALALPVFDPLAQRVVHEGHGGESEAVLDQLDERVSKIAPAW